MTKPVLPFLETMVVYGCNLSCLGCTNYSDYNMSGVVPWEQGAEWISEWTKRVDIPDFGIIGGEPLMHPQISQWITGIRDLLPTSQIRFTTNGTLLLKKFDVVKTLFDVGNSVIKISVHQPQDFYTQECINALMNYAVWTPVVEHGVKRWSGPNNTKLQINFPQTFVKSYQGKFTTMMPHVSNPVDSFKHCIQQRCPLLYNGRIYKCSSIALLERVTTDWQRSDDPAWKPFLDYKGIGTDCSDKDLDYFLNLFGQPENICSMCPDETYQESFVPHVATVSSKIQWIQINNASS